MSKIKTENITVRMTKEMHEFVLKEANGIPRDMNSIVRKYIEERMEKNTLHWIVKFDSKEQLEEFLNDPSFKKHFYELSNMSLHKSKQTILYTK